MVTHWSGKLTNLDLERGGVNHGSQLVAPSSHTYSASVDLELFPRKQPAVGSDAIAARKTAGWNQRRAEAPQHEHHIRPPCKCTELARDVRATLQPPPGDTER